MPDSVSLLPYNNICYFGPPESKDSNPAQNQSTNSGLLLLYKTEKSNEKYTYTLLVPSSFPVSLKEQLISFLSSITSSSSSSSSSSFFYSHQETKDSFYTSFRFFSLCNIGSSKTNPKLIDTIRKNVVSGLSHLKNLNIQNIYLTECEYVNEMVIACYLSSYSYSLLKNKSENTKPEYKPVFRCTNGSNELYERGVLVSYYQNVARFLSDTPANLMTPSLFCEYAKDILNTKIFDKNNNKNNKNISVDVFGREYMEKNNMNLLLSVARGSQEEPKLLVLNYRGDTSTTQNVISLVGKGVTFDSGGISIKPSQKMAEMKADMMGAASVLCTICLIRNLNLKINVNLTIPLTENLPSGIATKPGDTFITKSINGNVSVEVDNTDAEGRLILGDAITHSLMNNPDLQYLIDVATLTGAIRIALGNVYIGLFSNSDELSEMILECGKETNDCCWRMPLDKIYRKCMVSDVADLKNANGTAGAGSCTAAIFLNEFVEKKGGKSVKWAHLDVAGVMINDVCSELYGKGMSGKPVMMMVKLIERICQEKNK